MAGILALCLLVSTVDRAGLPTGLITGVALLRGAPAALVAFVAGAAVAGALGDLACYAVGARWLRADAEAPPSAARARRFRERVQRWLRPVRTATPLWLCLGKLTLPANLAITTAAGAIGYGPWRTFAWCALASACSMSAWAAIAWYGLAPLLALPAWLAWPAGLLTLAVLVVAGRAVDRRLAPRSG